MKLELSTLIFFTALVFATQIVAFVVQYRINRTYLGLGLWLTGTILQSLGFLFMAILNIPYLWILSLLANPLVVAGQLALHAGSRRFLGLFRGKWLYPVIFAAFVVPYYAFIFLYNSIFARSLLVDAFTSLIALKIALSLSVGSDSSFRGSARFTSVIFSVYGFFQLAMFLLTLLLPQPESYANFLDEPLRLLPFVLPPVTSTLWSFGFILMINQRLNSENHDEKEKLRTVFATSPDAQLITRLDDGAIVEANRGFEILCGFSRDEMIGKPIHELGIWSRPEDRWNFLDILDNRGSVDQVMYDFSRKDRTRFQGKISAARVSIGSCPHLVSVIRDVTEQVAGERKIRELVQALETEKNAAQRSAVTDSLTGLTNRRHFDDVLESEHRRLKRSLAPLSLLMLDIDHFKAFNDTYGHLAGDNCLRKVGSVLSSCARRSVDTVSRYGGEEFAVIMPETSKEAAFALAESIRQGIADLGIPHAASDVAPYVTVCLGVVTSPVMNLATGDQLIDLADKALYRAKNSGRNRTVCSPC